MRLRGMGQRIAKVFAPFLVAGATQTPPFVAETAWAECEVNIRVHRSLWHREVVPFRVRYRICHFATVIHTYLPRIKCLVELEEYEELVLALAHISAGEVLDLEPILVVLAVVAEEQFSGLYERPASFLQREVVEPLALLVEGVAGERLGYHVVIMDEELFHLLETVHVPSRPMVVM